MLDDYVVILCLLYPVSQASPVSGLLSPRTLREEVVYIMDLREVLVSNEHHGHQGSVGERHGPQRSDSRHHRPQGSNVGHHSRFKNSNFLLT